jgi:hypothetical protein
MYFLMSGTILNSCPKLITYLVSKIRMLMFPKISSKIIFAKIICVVNWMCCLLIIGWFTSSNKPTQFEWSSLLNSISDCDIKSFPCSSLIVWTKESCIHSFVCQSVVAFAFINSHSLSTYCYRTWLCVMQQ